jgi:hypothetical protein
MAWRCSSILKRMIPSLRQWTAFVVDSLQKEKPSFEQEVAGIFHAIGKDFESGRFT